jgi:hypothetical protein
LIDRTTANIEQYNQSIIIKDCWNKIRTITRSGDKVITHSIKYSSDAITKHTDNIIKYISQSKTKIDRETLILTIIKNALPMELLEIIELPF